MPKLKGPAATARNLFRLKGHKKCRDVGPSEGNEDSGGVAMDRDPSGPDSKQALAEPSAVGFSESPPRPPRRTHALQRTKSFSPWIGGDFFICISVKEGIDLFPGVSVRSATCDSFVRVTLQRPASLPIHEAETRVLARNCYPMWEECLPFPLNHMPEDTVINLRVLDKDIGHFNSFLGVVSLPLKDALAAMTGLNQEKIYRLPLMDRHGTVRKRGELVFGVSIVAQHEYREMRTVITAIQDPDQVHDALRDYSLHIKLHSVRELMGLPSSMLTSLKAEVNVCSTELRTPLVGELVAGGVDVSAGELVVPLGPAFRDGDTLKGKTRAQFGEVKVELLGGKVRLAKTQIPIWDVPFRPEGLGLPGGPSSTPMVGRHTVRRSSTTGITADASSGSEDEFLGESESGDELDSLPAAPVEAPPEGVGEKKNLLSNFAANIASVVAGAALARSSDAGCLPPGLGPFCGAGPMRQGDAASVSAATAAAAAAAGAGAGAAGLQPRSPDQPSQQSTRSELSVVLRPGEAGTGAGSRAAESLKSPLGHPSVSPGSVLFPLGDGSVGAGSPDPSGHCPTGGGDPATNCDASSPWGGKKYSRRMERLERNLVRPPVVVLTMQLVKTPNTDDNPSRNGGGTTASQGGAAADRSSSSSLDFEASDVEKPAEPLAAPTPLGTPIADFLVAAGPHALARAAFAEGAELGLRVMAIEKMTDLKITPWGPDPEGKALCVRSMTYMKPTIVGPTAVNSSQKLLAKHDGGFVIMQHVMPTVPPAGQVVRVEVQIVGQHAGPNKTRMSATLATHWLKSGMMVNMVKGKVEDATPKDTRKYFDTMRRELEAKFGALDQATGAVTASAASVVAAAAQISGSGAAGAFPVVAPADATHTGGAAAASFGLMTRLAVLGATAVLVLVLAGVLLRVSSELSASRRAVEGLAGELRAVTAALEAVTRQMARGVGTGTGTELGTGPGA